MPLKRIKLFIYLLQLENYDLARFLRLVKKAFWRARVQPRKPITWTFKMRLIVLLALLGYLGLVFALGFSLMRNGVFSVAFILLSMLGAVLVGWFCFFILLVLAVIALSPVDWLIKSWLIFLAKRKIAGLKNLTVIGITGSYGKTTMKEMLAAVLSEKFQVVKTAENLNTPLGLARLVLKELSVKTDVLLVEMGAYQRGDIKTLCAIARPDLSVLTGINASHLERFGSLANTVSAKFEIVENSKASAPAVLNGDNELIVSNYKDHLAGRTPLFYGFNKQAQFQIKENRFLKNKLAREVNLEDPQGKSYTFLVPLLGRYAAATLGACLSVARHFKLSPEEVKRGLIMLRPIKHRLEPFRAPHDVLIIDDSYNGNEHGALEAVSLLQEFPERRRVYVTPGLVELGSQMESAHFALADKLKTAVELVVLIRSEGARLLQERLLNSGFPVERLIVFDSAPEAHAGLSAIIKGGDVVLFQNDLPDNYTL